MNPYQPPQCSEPVSEVAGAAVMRVRYSWAYSLGVIFAGLAMVTSGIRTNPLVPSGVLFVMGGFHLAMGVITRIRTLFEVFEDRVEFLPMVWPKRRRRVVPLESIGSGSLLFRWLAKREDFKRFIAWRSQRELPSAR